MTCIAGVAHKGKVYIGGDSAAVDGYGLTVRRDVKVFRNGPFVIGFTSSFRMGQVLAHAFKPPPVPKKRADLERYMVVDFVDALRAALKEKGWATVQNGREEGGCFLVGVAGRLFRIDNDFQVGEARDGVDAVGCGFAVAQGALHVTRHLKPEARVRAALKAAERWNGGVRAPFVVVAG